MDLYLELDKRSSLPADSRLATAYRDRTVHVDYLGRTDRCGRCGREVGAHTWRVFDTSIVDQNGVLDCGIAGEEQ